MVTKEITFHLKFEMSPPAILGTDTMVKYYTYHRYSIITNIFGVAYQSPTISGNLTYIKNHFINNFFPPILKGQNFFIFFSIKQKLSILWIWNHVWRNFYRLLNVRNMTSISRFLTGWNFYLSRPRTTTQFNSSYLMFIYTHHTSTIRRLCTITNNMFNFYVFSFFVCTSWNIYKLKHIKYILYSHGIPYHQTKIRVLYYLSIYNSNFN